MIKKRKLSYFTVVLACVGMVVGWIVVSAVAGNCIDNCWCNDYVTSGTYPNADCGGESFMYTTAICRAKFTVKCDGGCMAGAFMDDNINTNEWVLRPGGGCSGCNNINTQGLYWQDQSGVFGTYVIDGIVVSTGQCMPGG